MISNRGVLITLVLICALGLIAIPFGNPKFINEAITLELSLIVLAGTHSAEVIRNHFMPVLHFRL